MRDVVITSALRTAVGRAGGALAEVRADDLAAVAVRAVVEQGRLPVDQIEDVILGCANQAGEDNRNVARMAALLAGLPVEVPGQTDRLCGSACGPWRAPRTQSVPARDLHRRGRELTRAPSRSRAAPWSRTPPSMADTTVGWRFTNPAMAGWTILLETAERVAARYQISRADQDAFAAESRRRSRPSPLASSPTIVPVPCRWQERAVVANDQRLAAA
jgi:acetyl-CoA acetyltransferase